MARGFHPGARLGFAAVYPSSVSPAFRRRGRFRLGALVDGGRRWSPACWRLPSSGTQGLPVAPNAAYARSLCLRISLRIRHQFSGPGL